MRLIGMLDSPYVRRVAISLQLLGLPFEHRSISVFRAFDEFRAINPVVKAPSLVCDDGTVLMDSTLILEYAENLARGRRSLMPATVSERLSRAHSPRSISDKRDLLIPARPAITRSDFFRELRIWRSRAPIVRGSSMSTRAPSPHRNPSPMPRGATPGRKPR